ncbi:NAD(+)--dinitrogen-reductase ADP-D-ribosyltransferase [Thiosocius teredinicola]|uniref:NAD(+)--dinitrogen-reductase ADP-D-ribosyltransferase n=1 Tax=Thiosocius teredinicola TaxID=1973002 RepID=UPI00099114AC
MDNNKTHTIDSSADVALPRNAGLSFNRCNVPTRILGSLAFQAHPRDIQLDGVSALHAGLFSQLDAIDDVAQRQALFRTHMAAIFQLNHPDEAGYDAASRHPGRPKADYLRLLRGWLFDSNSREGAVMKGWVESRFGLSPRAHRGPLRSFSDNRYHQYCIERAIGLHNTNALEAQLDLLYTYCQYELRRTHPRTALLRLYRGTNQISEYELLSAPGAHRQVLLLNNLNSFASSAERAGEFGDCIVAADVPCAKLMFFPSLLSGQLQGEDEHLVIGGVYQVSLQRL